MITNRQILGVICKWINTELGYKAIQAPSDNPAPAGRYISATIGNVHQHGDMFIPGPDKTKKKSVMNVAQVQLYEVEGDGEWLRDIKNRIQLPEFDSFVKANTEQSTSQDNCFSVWDIGEIVDNSTQDGAYWIRQKTLSFDVQFIDYIGNTGAERMMSVTGKLNNEPFAAEVETNG